MQAKSSVEKGHINCGELRDFVVRAITEAGGKIDYAEVSHVVPFYVSDYISNPIHEPLNLEVIFLFNKCAGFSVLLH